MTPQRLTLAIATSLSGLSAGFFFTYQASVILGLAQVGDVAYVETFQAINETVRNPAFGLVFFGSVPAIVIALGVNWKASRPTQRMFLAAALPLYLAGMIITVAGNVPLNEALAAHDGLTPSVAALARADFEDAWNQLNLSRALAIGASFAALVGASSPTSVRRDSPDGRNRDDPLLIGHTGSL